MRTIHSAPFALAVTALAVAAPVTMARAQVPALPSATAKTVQVTVKQWATLPAPQGQPNPFVAIALNRVQIDRAGDKAKISQTALPDAPKGFKPSLMVHDGKAQYELIGSRNQFLKAADATPVAGGVVSRVGLVGAGLSLALGTNKTATAFVSAPGETLDGKAVDVYLRAYDMKNGEQAYHYDQKLFVDKTTHLPVRYSLMFAPKGEAAKEVSREEYSAWTLDAPLAPSLFAWTPPAGATEYKAPERPVLLTVGTLAPDFTVAKYGGGNLKLSDYRGKVVILDFWATWCGPCQRSMPHVEKVHQMTQAGGEVVTLGVCVWDTKAKYDGWMPANKSKYTFTFGYDAADSGPESIATKLYKVSGIPTTYVIDKDGKVAAAIVGYQDGDDRLEQTLAKLGVKMAAQTASAK